MSDDYAIDTAARFGDIPFVDFTTELVTGVFDSLVEAHLMQMEEYSSFINSMTQDLSTYINNTADGVSFDQISDFILKYELPKIGDEDLKTVMDALNGKGTEPPSVDVSSAAPADANKWWGGLINALAPSVENLVDKIKDPNQADKYKAISDYNNAVLTGTTAVVPNYQQIYDSIAALIVSNKYGLLQTMAKQGLMRLVVTEGEIETKITFSTWNNSTTGSESSLDQKVKNKDKLKKAAGGGILGLFRASKKSKTVNRTVTVNTAKSYQRDSSGTKVDIFGRVLIRFKTDYAPLNG